MKNFFLLFFLFGSALLGRQHVSSQLSGRVSNHLNEPMSGVTVLLKHEPSATYRGALTNVDGRFSIGNLRAGGPYSLMLSYTGYTFSKIDTLMLEDNQKKILSLQMKPL